MKKKAISAVKPKKTNTTKTINKNTTKTKKESCAVKVDKTKPEIKITIEKNILGQAPEHHEFILNDGKKLKNIYHLIDELESMNEDAFRQHVNGLKNDFANWIENIFENKGLAEELRQIENRLDTQRAILKELVRQLTLITNKK